MRWLKQQVRQLAQRCGYRITRNCLVNRFDGMRETLMFLRSKGNSPRAVIDAGANLGTFTVMASAVFPEAEFHAIEPQPGCAKPLRELSRRIPRLSLHMIAVTRPGVDRVRMIGGGEAGNGTGAWVAGPGEQAPGEFECRATTLDDLFADRLSVHDRALLKLDLEGHERIALQGGTRLLRVIEAIITEVQFYDVGDKGRPTFADMLDFLRHRGFELYDFAALSGRSSDMRLRMGDVVFVRKDSPLWADRSWE